MVVKRDGVVTCGTRISQQSCGFSPYARRSFLHPLFPDFSVLVRCVLRRFPVTAGGHGPSGHRIGPTTDAHGGRPRPVASPCPVAVSAGVPSPGGARAQSGAAPPPAPANRTLAATGGTCRGSCGGRARHREGGLARPTRARRCGGPRGRSTTIAAAPDGAFTVHGSGPKPCTVNAPVPPLRAAPGTPPGRPRGPRRSP